MRRYTALWSINVRKRVTLQTNVGLVINGKLRGTVVTYLRCGGIVNNQINKGLVLNLLLNFF